MSFMVSICCEHLEGIGLLEAVHMATSRGDFLVQIETLLVFTDSIGP